MPTHEEFGLQFGGKKQDCNKLTPPITCTPAPIKAGKQLHPVRQNVIDTAQAYVAKIGDVRGRRNGADLLQDVYNTAYHDDTSKYPGWAKQIQTSGQKPNSWCGIFAVAMARKGGVKSAQWARWDAKPAACPVGLAAPISSDGKFEPGDILVIKDKPGKPQLNHHCLCKSVDGNTVSTIDGNSFDYKTMSGNTVAENKRSRADIRGYYKLIPDPAWVPLVGGKADNCEQKKKYD